MPLYSHRATGEKRIDDDFVDALRGLMAILGVDSDPLTTNELIERAMPEKYKYETSIAQSPYQKGLTPAQEMSYLYQRAMAAKEVAQRPDSWQLFDEDGNLVLE